MAITKKAITKKAARARGKARGEPPRTARIRYVEPPTKPDGNPFFALRVPADLLRAFRAHAKKKRTSATALVRAHMSRVTGVAVAHEDEQ